MVTNGPQILAKSGNGDAANSQAKRPVLRIDRGRNIPPESIEEMLSSAVAGADTELGQILREVSRISRALRSDSPDPETLRIAVHPAIWSALKQSLLDRELRYLALTDDLTCLYNRRGFFAAATQHLQLAKRNGEALLLLFCDVNDLKKINDTYGHPEGDLALIRTADALEQVFRSSDILGRIGGDEFVVLALGASSQSREIVLSRLKETLKQANTLDSRYQLSLSVGVARFDPKHPVSLGDLIAEADRAMYQQKPSHRKSHEDRTHSSPPGQRD
jgi:diguanylate cyclase (GGDEF)-like protein